MSSDVRRVVCPGSFDPVTHGHLDVFRRASVLFDEVLVAVGVNATKSATRWFDPAERMEMLRDAVADLPNVRVVGFSGLLVDFCVEQGAVAVVKGLRNAADYGFEQPMANMNAHLKGVDTVFLACDPQWSFVSSSLVQEVLSLGGDVSAFVPPAVLDRLVRRRDERLGAHG